MGWWVPLGKTEGVKAGGLTTEAKQTQAGVTGPSLPPAPDLTAFPGVPLWLPESS